jgi:hypothetical protein
LFELGIEMVLRYAHLGTEHLQEYANNAHAGQNQVTNWSQEKEAA